MNETPDTGEAGLPRLSAPRGAIQFDPVITLNLLPPGLQAAVREAMERQKQEARSGYLNTAISGVLGRSAREILEEARTGLRLGSGTIRFVPTKTSEHLRLVLGELHAAHRRSRKAERTQARTITKLKARVLDLETRARERAQRNEPIIKHGEVVTLEFGGSTTRVKVGAIGWKQGDGYTIHADRGPGC